MNATYGLSSSASFAKLDHDGYWLKMYQGYSQLTLEGSSEAFCETWPASGTMSSGIAYQRARSARPIDASESGSLPTPRASDAVAGGRGDLLMLLRGYESKRRHKLPTPTARDWKSMLEIEATHEGDSRTLSDVLGRLYGKADGLIDPLFLEWLLGYPTGWTALEL